MAKKENKVYGFVFSSTKTVLAHFEKATAFPDLSGSPVVFEGVDTWLMARHTLKWSGTACVIDVPVFLERLGIAVCDGLHKGLGVWHKEPIRLNDSSTVDLSAPTLINALAIENAQTLSRLVQAHPELLKSGHFHRDALSTVVADAAERKARKANHAKT